MDIQHDPQQHRFVAKLGEHEATVSYVEREGKVLDFYHVFVPPEFRGRGAAARILKFAFEYARDNDYKVVPTCPFIAGEFLPRFTQYQDLVAD